MLRSRVVIVANYFLSYLIARLFSLSIRTEYIILLRLNGEKIDTVRYRRHERSSLRLTFPRGVTSGNARRETSRRNAFRARAPAACNFRSKNPASAGSI